MTILFFALFGLSFYQANGDGFSKPSTSDSEGHTNTTSPVPYANSKNCLAQAFKKSAKLFEDVSVFLCEYQACKKGDNCNYENFKKTLTTFINAANYTGCQVDLILGTNNTFEKIFTEISGSRLQVGELVEKLVESLGIAKPVADALCFLVGGILKSECVQNALGNLAPSAVKALTALYCQEGDSEKEMSENVANILDVPCGLHKDELAYNLELLGDALKPVVATILVLTKQIPVLDKSLCTVHNVRLGINNGGI